MRVHITSSGPRTGSTLLFEKLKTLRLWKQASAHEDHIFVNDRDVNELSAQGSHILTKSPRHCLLVYIALSLRSDLLVISVVRDPRDVVLSKHSGDPGMYYSDMSFFFRYMNMRKWFLRKTTFIEVKYEDLVACGDTTIDKIITFLRSHNIKCQPNRDASSEISKEALLALGGVRPLDLTSIDKWKSPHAAHVMEYYHAKHGKKLSARLQELGYETFSGRKYSRSGVVVRAKKKVRSDDRHFIRNLILLLKNHVAV